jgi:hypothetical protein
VASPFVGRWSLPGVEEQARLRPLWRTGALAFWVGGVGGEWVTLQAAEAAPAPPSEEEDVEQGTTKQKQVTGSTANAAAPAAATEDTSRGSRSRRSRRSLPPGAYVVLTAYNPMGTLRADAANAAAARALAGRRGVAWGGCVSLCVMLIGQPCVVNQ